VGDSIQFETDDGHQIPALTEAQMREVDRIAMQDFGLGVLQMMENAGRNLALHVIEMLGEAPGGTVVLAGSGGNGGGGICCARHLHNRGYPVRLFLTRAPDTLRGSAADQYRILQNAGLLAEDISRVGQAMAEASVTVDALIGYSLQGAPRGLTADLIEQCNARAGRVLSLDIPSGVHSATGARPGVAVEPDRTLTLALPKLGLATVPGELYLADIGIPPEVYKPLGVRFEPFFGDRYWVRIRPVGEE
jgi:NAD(P)H-hydrate epimerase